MAMTATEFGRPETPRHFWAVAVLGLLWNAYGGFDYTMSHLQGEAYYRQSGMSDGQIAYMASYPVWMHAVWAIGVWGAVAGSVLMLLRSRWASPAFTASIAGAIGNTAYTAVAPGGPGVMGLALPMVIVSACLFFIWYARMMTRQGVLR